MSLLDTLAIRYPSKLSTFTVTLNTTHPHHKLRILASLYGTTPHELLERYTQQCLQRDWEQYLERGETLEEMEKRLLGSMV